MKCPYCRTKQKRSDGRKLLDTREVKIGTRRRYECQTCFMRFTTYELTQKQLLLGYIAVQSNSGSVIFSEPKK